MAEKADWGRVRHHVSECTTCSELKPLKQITNFYAQQVIISVVEDREMWSFL